MTSDLLGANPWALPVICYFIVSRIGYAGGVGVALALQEQRQYFTQRYGVEPGFRRFSRLAAFLMNNDALSFILVCLVTWNTFTISPWIRVAAGVPLILAGLGIKRWAAVSVPDGTYFWRNFFVADQPIMTGPPGPYRYLNNPMYTVGYLHCYGAALLAASLAGMAAAVFSQAAILLFNHLVEKPHWERIQKADSVSS